MDTKAEELAASIRKWSFLDEPLRILGILMVAVMTPIFIWGVIVFSYAIIKFIGVVIISLYNTDTVGWMIILAYVLVFTFFYLDINKHDS